MNRSHSDSDEELSASGDPDELSDLSSSSGDDSSSNSSSSSTTDAEDSQPDSLELAKIENEVLRLPRGLCESAAIFHEFFSAETWNMLPEQFQARLQEHLPRFSRLLDPHEAATERQRTLELLFNGELQRFGHTPLVDLQHQLEEGNCRPDVLQLRQSIAKSQRRELRFQHCERLSQLAKHLFVSRERLLRNAYKSTPDALLRAERSMRREKTALHADTKLCAVRARKRFRQDMEQMAQQLGLKADELSADEEDNGSGLEERQRDLKIDLTAGLKTSSTPTDRCIYSTLFKRHSDLADEEAVRANQLQQQQQQRLSNRTFRTCLREHKRRKLTEPSLPDFETSDIRLRDVCARAQMGNNFKHIFGVGRTPGRKPKSKVLPPNEPPALVPIQTPAGRQTDDENPAQRDESADVSLGSFCAVTTSGSAMEVLQQQQQHMHVDDNVALHAHAFMPEDGTPFNILDGEVELQQEEVETYRTSEETIPHFVISNEVVLPAIEQSDVPPQKLLQTPHKDDSGAAQQQQVSPVEESSQVVEQLSMPRLEPLSSIHKTPSREKPRPQMLNYNSANNNINVTPTRKPQPIGVNKSTAVASSYSAELIQETHSCFFSLIRDFFCATPNHRMQYEELRERIDVWLCNPITALNDWYAQADNWSALLTSAINFLAGEFSALPDEYVPYIEFKPQHNIYQWIGAGRDSDTRLSTLCSYWLQRRHEVPDKPLVGARQQRDAAASVPLRRHSIEMEDGISAVYDGGVSPPPPPPPRYPTTWTVCAATPAEIAEFQRQERERFEQPHRAYTYRMHGYESVVGPVKGIYTQMLALTKARGHSMMVVNRPNFVTILTLVRDATARLPNGEGTRADIAELLKSSQYINLKEGENVLQTTVSGALDRMHTEHDPCVRYDPKRKIWIYLHRNRTEEEFERMHQQYQGLGKCKKGAVPRKPKTRPVQTKGAADGAEANGAGGPIESAVVSPAATPIKNVTTFSLPALVPANPIIVNSQSAMGTQKPPPPVKQPLTKSLPVPPLKYNIPHPQQKSLLKSTLQTQRQQEHKSMEGAGEQQQQRIQGRNTAASNNAMSAVATAAASGKQFSFTMPSGKQANAVAAVGNNTTPIIVATPTGLQTVHVSNANVVSAATLTSSAATMQLQPNSALSATVGGKKVALNKPIIINQITAQPVSVAAAAKAKSAAQHTLKQSAGTPQQPQQPHSFIIPISMASAVTGSAAGGEYIDGQLKETTMRQQIVSTANSGATTIYMDGSQLLAADNQPPQQSSPQQQHTKNIIRLVPAISSSSGGGGSKQPVHVIGHRMVTANTGINVRPPQLQSKAIGGGITLSSAKSNNSAVVATTAGGSTLIKMSPQAFATLQQKQGPHILVKQHQQQQQPQQQQQQHHQRVIVGNTAIIAQSAGGQAAGKKIFMQQQSPLASAAHKTVATGSQTSGSLNISAGAASPVSNKIHTINASNLTPQQQRVLLQNLKQQQQQQQQQQQPHQQQQQQQQIQFKTVQVMSNAAVQQSQQLEPAQSHVVARSQGVTVISQQQQHQLGAGATAQATQTAGKTVAVMVSQPQGLTRILKQQQQTVSVSNEATQAGTGAPTATRVLTTSTGQIISLDSLLQKQGGTLKISGGAAATATKPVQAGAYVQQQVNAAAGGGTTYAVVTPARSNVITMGTSSGQRVISTQATLANTAESAQKATASSGSGTGRIVMSSSGQLTMPQIAKVLSKAGAGAAGAAAAGGSNIRVIKSSAGAGGAASFNITNLQGKQVVFATKAPTAKNVVATVSGSQVQTQQLQTAGSVVLGGQTVKLQRNQLNKATGGINVITSQPGTQMQTVIMGNQILRVQQMPQQTVRAVGGHSVAQQRVATMPLTTVANSNNTPSTVVVNSNEALLNAGAVGGLPKTLVIGSTGQTIRLQQQQQPAQPLATQTQTQLATVKNVAQQATKGGNANRVVLAVQGGGQIFLSPNFQGNTLNLKSLQNMKVVSLGSRAVASADTQQQPEKTPATSSTATTVANVQQQSMLRSSGANNV